MERTFPMKYDDGTNYNLTLVKSMYVDNHNLYLGLNAIESGPFANITVNIDKLPYGQAAVDTNNCSWVEEFIAQHKLGKKTDKTLKSGYCTYPVYEFDMKLIDEIAEEPHW